MEDFSKERFDRKRFLLQNRKNAWKILVVAVLGAILCGSFYWLYQNVIAPKQIYQSKVLYAITFDQEQVGDIHDYYNDYTWNDILDSDQIAGEAAHNLEGMSKEEIAESATIPTMSDIRFLWIEVNAATAEKADVIQQALGDALISFADRTAGFQKIEIWDKQPTKIVNGENFLLRVASTGFVVFAVFYCLFLSYKSAMDDSVYTEGELERRYGILTAGCILTGNCTKKSIQQTQAELVENLVGLSDKKHIGVVFLEDKEQQETLKTLKKCFADEIEIVILDTESDENKYNDIRKKDAWILVVSAGCHDGAFLDKQWKNYRYQNCMPDAVILNNVDGWFYNAYYHKDRLSRQERE